MLFGLDCTKLNLVNTNRLAHVLPSLTSRQMEIDLIDVYKFLIGSKKKKNRCDDFLFKAEKQLTDHSHEIQFSQVNCKCEISFCQGGDC